MALGLGPVFVYESIVAARRGRVYAGRACFVLLLLAGMSVVWLVYAEGIFNPSFRRVPSYKVMAAIGARYFYALTGVQRHPSPHTRTGPTGADSLNRRGSTAAARRTVSPSAYEKSLRRLRGELGSDLGSGDSGNWCHGNWCQSPPLWRCCRRAGSPRRLAESGSLALRTDRWSLALPRRTKQP
jgi:hypothetical protein